MDYFEMRIGRARTFAMAAHAAVGQLRKYTNEPYIVHPQEVVALLYEHVPHASTSMIEAAWLHDVVEDTRVSANLIRQICGDYVAQLVVELTDISRPEDGNRAVRKEKDRQHLARASAAAQTIKLADLISNTRSIVKHDPDFAKVYLKEKRALLEVLTKGDAELWNMAWELCGDEK